MDAVCLTILEKTKKAPESLCSIADFRYRESGTIPLSELVDDKSYSPYCIDDSKRRVIFVKVPKHVNLIDNAFYYQAQYQHAKELLAVDYDKLSELHRLIKERVNSIKNIVWLYSTGRCGSTLLSRAFSQLSNVGSLSEPDFFSQIVGIRCNASKNRDDELREIILCCTPLLYRDFSENTPEHCLVIKLRGFCIEIWDLIDQAYPDSKNIFLYRNALQVTESNLKSFFSHYGIKNIMRVSRVLKLDNWLLGFVVRKFGNRIRPYFSILDRYSIEVYQPLGIVGGVFMGWLSPMEKCLEAKSRGLAVFVLRYEDLILNPKLMLTQLLERLSLKDRMRSDVFNEFTMDSQRGSSLRVTKNKKAMLNERDKKNIMNFLQQYSPINSVDFVFEDSLKLKVDN